MLGVGVNLRQETDAHGRGSYLFLALALLLSGQAAFTTNGLGRILCAGTWVLIMALPGTFQTSPLDHLIQHKLHPS